MKANYKWLKAILALGFKNFGPSSVVSKLVKFPLFDNFFLDLAKFQDLNIFSLFDFPNLDNFPNFLAYSTPFLPTLNLLILLSPTLSCSGVNFSGGTVVFSIEMGRAAILLKPWMNC